MNEVQGRYHVTRDTLESGNDPRGYSSLYQRRQRRKRGWMVLARTGELRKRKRREFHRRWAFMVDFRGGKLRRKRRREEV